MQCLPVERIVVDLLKRCFFFLKNEANKVAKRLTTPPRRHYATTEEKIQAELREMKKREEELK